MRAGGSEGYAYAFWVKVVEKQHQLGLTNTELADRAGLTRATIDRLKTGKRAPTDRTVHSLADVLGIPRRDAERLAGLVPPPSTRPERRDLPVRAVIDASEYSPQERELLHRLLDVLDRPRHSETAVERPEVGTTEVG